MILDLTSFFSPKSFRTILNTSGYEPLKIYQTSSPLWCPNSFRSKLPRLGVRLGAGPLAMLLFAPLIAFGSLTGRSDNLTAFARANR